MTRGKIISQCCHATIETYNVVSGCSPNIIRRWKADGQPTITLKVSSEDELRQLVSKAKSLGIFADFVEDAGRTQVDVGTLTVACIGPGPVDAIDKLTGHLKLY